MVTFDTKQKAEAFAVKRRKGFRSITKRDPNRRSQMNKAIKSVKVKRIQRKGWSSPIYEVVGQ